MQSKGKNILEVEKEYIQESYKKAPDKSLNISNTKNIDYREKLGIGFNDKEKAGMLADRILLFF